MAIIHMQTESVINVVRQLQAGTQQVRDQASLLENTAHSLEWVGPNRDQFLADLSSLLSGIVRQTDAGEILSQRAEREVQEWEDVCAKMEGGYLDIGVNLRNIIAAPMPALSAVGAVAAAAAQSWQVLGASTTTSSSASGAWSLGSGAYSERMGRIIDEQYAAKIDPLQQDLDHYRRAKAGFEASLAHDEEFLKELEENLKDARTHDNLPDWLKDKFNDLIGNTRTYEEVRQQTLDRIASTKASLAALDGQISSTNAQIQEVNVQKQAALDHLMKGPNTAYPVTPANPDAIPQKGYCMKYVSDFRGQPPAEGGIPRSGSAADLVHNEKYADLRYQVPPNSTDLRDQVVPGTVVAWDRGQQGANATHGHAAVVTEVGKDYVIVKESSWGGAVGQPRKIPIGKLSELTLIGYDSIPRT